MINRVKTILKLKTKEDALKFHLFAVSIEEGLNLSPSDINIIVEIYNNGYNQDLFSSCVDKKYFKSEYSVRNCVSKLTKKGILQKSYGHRKVNSSFLPDLNDSDILFSYDVIYSDFLKK